MEARALAPAFGRRRCSTRAVMRSATAATPPHSPPGAGRPRRALAAAPGAAPAGGPGAHRPRFRPGLVARERPLARPCGARDVPLVLLVAPARDGKTTVLAQGGGPGDPAVARVGPPPEGGGGGGA